MSTFLQAFATIFVAEFADKTQLAVIALTASTRKPWAVFLGASLALSAVTVFGVLFGQAALRLVPEALLRRAAAAVFVAFGVWMWFKP